MKLTFLLMFLAFLQVSANVVGQGKISLKVDQVEISRALRAIERQGTYRFLYNSQLGEIRKKISINESDSPIGEVLNKLFSGTDLTYKMLANNLIVVLTEGQSVKDTRITGKITSTAGDPLVGVSVRIKGSTVGTQTDASGNFTLNAPDNATLVISYVGFNTQEIPVNGRTSIDLTLTASTKVMDEVVVIGYGTANKRDLTGSIVKIDGKQVADKPNVNPISSLQGKVAGLSVVQSSTPGSEPDIRIRGTISIGSVKPVYVVDGILNDNIDFINPNDIESIEVLKDPSSLAIFGVRGAAGAIVITTKKAKEGQLMVSLNSNIGVKSLVDKIKLTNASDFKTLYSEQLQNQGSTAFDYTNWNANTDWIDALSRKALFSTSNLSVTSSTTKNKFYMNMGYTKDEGIVRHENLSKILLSINDELKISKALKIGFNFSGIKQNPPYLGENNNYDDVLTDARRIAPIASATAKNGYYSVLPGFQSSQIENPAMILENTYDKNFKNEYRTVGSVFAELTILKDLNFRYTGYGDITNGNATSYSPIIKYYLPDTHDSVVTDPNYKNTSLTLPSYRRYKWQQDFLLNYRKNFGDHSLSALGGFTTYYQSEFNTSITGKQSTTGDPIPNDKRMWYISNAYVDATTVRATSSQWERTTASLLARVLYNYNGKYYLNGSFRRDGSSGFANHKYQNFWAVGGAWELTKENFLSDIKHLNYLKLKGSIGLLGNQNTTDNSGNTYPYPSYPLLNTAQNAVFGSTVYPAYTAQYEPDPNLHWETVKAKEIGVEAEAFDHTLHFEAAYYHKETDGLLALQPSINGSLPKLSNIGSILNRGFEFSASWEHHLGKDLTLTLSGNLTTYYNRVLSLYSKDPDGITGTSEEYPNRTAIGKPIGFFYGYVAQGVFQSSEDSLKYPKNTQFSPDGPGDLKFKDLDGNDTINSKDRTMIGNPTPKFTYGVSIGLKYKNFDLGIDLQGVSGNQIYRYWGTSELTFAQFNYPQWKLGRWHGEGTSNSVPQLNNNHNVNSKGLSTFGIENGSYLRIRNIVLGYSIPTAALSRAHIKTFRIFVSAQNMKTFKHNYGFTPDFPGTATSFGIDNGNGPSAAIYTGGISVTF